MPDFRVAGEIDVFDAPDFGLNLNSEPTGEYPPFEGRTLTLSRDEVVIAGDETGVLTLQVTDRSAKETAATLLSAKDVRRLLDLLEHAQRYLSGG